MVVVHPVDHPVQAHPELTVVRLEVEHQAVHPVLGQRPEDVPANGPCQRLAGADVVEVLPTAIGSADVTALVAERVVRELLTGIALRRA
jgi:hypothetical protein